MVDVTCQMVEFHRYGRPQMILLRENRYIRTTGWDTLAQEVSPSLDQEDLLVHLNALRYEGVASAEEACTARTLLAQEAARFLDRIAPADDELLQVDLVTNAAELWAFPFEACFAQHPAWLKSADHGVVVTRRVRSEFAGTSTQWPVTPRVLFAHAPVTRDLEQALVDAHIEALSETLAPWARGKDVQASGLLTVREVTSAQQLTRDRDELVPTYVHVLAHGAPTRRDPRLPQRETWGLRLGYEGEPGIEPADIAQALAPRNGLPVVVTVAACDSANQASPAFAVQSVVQELHRCGVPVVVGSQLPLTKAGSSVLTRAFYERLLLGQDVRVALHAARVALHADEASGHDWMSLVGYVRLPPEGYADHLAEFGLRLELQLLQAAQVRADLLAREHVTRDEFAALERDLYRRLESLAGRQARLANRRDLIDECCGLRASAYKRLAELLFERGRRFEDRRADDWQASKRALHDALSAYRTAYEANLQSHWLGVQQLSLEVVLNGRLACADDWTLVARSARLARDANRNDGALDYWSCGTLTELALLAPYAGRPRDVAAARAAAALLVERARVAGDQFAVASTRRQIDRYVRWWTTAHGFFPAGGGPAGDLSSDAREVLHVLE